MALEHVPGIIPTPDQGETPLLNPISQEIVRIYDNRHRAAKWVFRIALDLTPEELNFQNTPDQPTLMGRLAHLAQATEGWLNRWTGNGSEDQAGLSDGINDVFSHYEQVYSRLATFLKSLSDRDLESKVGFSRGDGAVRQYRLLDTLMHVAFHTQQHLSEAAEILTSLGHSPGELDVLLYAPFVKPGLNALPQ